MPGTLAHMGIGAIAGEGARGFNAASWSEEPSSVSRTPHIRRSLLMAVPVLALAATGALAQATDHSVGASHIKPAPDSQLLLNPYEAALQLEQNGDYAHAIELLEPEAKQGHGFEMAQLELGKCYLATANKAATPDAAVEATKKGAVWIETAATSGLAAAQEQMARLFIEGGRFKVEPVEAGKWYVLWKGNPNRYQAISKPFDPKLEQKLKATLTDAQWDQARQAAIELARKYPPQ
jgi:hypothetical protein